MPKKAKADKRLTVRVSRAFYRSLVNDAANHHSSISARVLHALRGMGHPLHTPEKLPPA